MAPEPDRLIVFAKAPRPGTVKTRLIPLLGADGAAALHRELIEHTLAMTRLAPASVELHGAPPDDFLRRCAERHGAALLAQSDGDLGERLSAAFDLALQSSRFVVVIGSDCAVLTAGHVTRAFAALRDGYDAVFCPTEDGGYALIGLARCHASLFSGIAWSTETVMHEARVRLHRLGWTALELETLWDVDRPPDYARLRASGLLAGAQAQA